MSIFNQNQRRSFFNFNENKTLGSLGIINKSEELQGVYIESWYDNIDALENEFDFGKGSIDVLTILKDTVKVVLDDYDYKDSIIFDENIPSEMLERIVDDVLEKDLTSINLYENNLSLSTKKVVDMRGFIIELIKILVQYEICLRR